MTKFDELIELIFRPLVERIDRIMATVEELQQQVADVKASLTAAIERVEADVDKLKEDLADQIDPSALDPISQSLAEVKASLDALDPVPDSPPPAEPQ